MLSNYERRIPSEIELDLIKIKGRSKLGVAFRALRLPVAFMALGTAMMLSAGDQLPGSVGVVLVAGAGVLVGWLLVGAIRRRLWGPRVRARLRRRRSPGSRSSNRRPTAHQ